MQADLQHLVANMCFLETLVSILVHFGNLGFHFTSFWKPQFPFWIILETLVSILGHFGNLSFHFGSFWKQRFPFQVILETLVSIKGLQPLLRRGCGGGAEGVQRGCHLLCRWICNTWLQICAFWKPWFPFQFILETLVSIILHFGNLGFHFSSSQNSILYQQLISKQ